MNVCVVHGSVMLNRGSGRYIYDLSTRLVEDGARVTLACFECEEALLRLPGLDVVKLPRAFADHGLWRIGHVADLAHLHRRLPRLLKGRRCDALIGSDLLFLSPARRALGPSSTFIYTPLSMIAPLEIASYELGGARHWLGVALYRRLQRWALKECDFVVRFTPSAVRALETYYRLDLANKAVVSVYVSREFDQARAEAGPMDFSRPRPAELIWVGGLIKSKNVDFLLRAVAKVRHPDWVLNVCSDGPDRHRLEALARDLGIAGKTKFRGIVTDLGAEYRNASMLLTGSVLEQYSLTLMEAYAFGVPCIGLKPDWKSVFNSNEDQIRHGETGFVVADEEDMAERVDYLLAHEEERTRMGCNAFRMKQQGFTFEAFYQVMKGLITSPRR